MVAAVRPRKVSTGSVGDGRETPQWLVDELAERYAAGAFDLDVAASAENAKAPHYFSAETNGLLNVNRWAGNVFCNPPWSSILPWVNKAIDEVEAGMARVVVMVLPSRTGSAWYAKCLRHAELISFIRGRPQFHRKDGKHNTSNPEDVIVVVFRKPIVVAELRNGRSE